MRADTRGRGRVPYAVVSRSTAQTITTGTDTVVSFDTAEADPFSMWDSAGKLIVPKGWAGLYTMSGTAGFSPGSDTTRRIAILAINNGAAFAGSSFLAAINSATDGTTVPANGLFPMQVGDYVELRCRHEHGSNLALSAAFYLNRLQIVWSAPL